VTLTTEQSLGVILALFIVMVSMSHLIIQAQ